MRIINLPSGSTVYSDDAIAVDREGTGSRKFNLFSWLQTHYRSKSALIEIEDGGTGADNASDARAALSVPTLEDGKVAPGQTSSTIVSVASSKTLGLTDAGTLQMANSAADIIITIPVYAAEIPGGNVAWATGTEIEIVRYGTGSVTVTGEVGVTLRSVGSLTGIADQYGCLCLKYMGSGEWLLAGDLG